MGWGTAFSIAARQQGSMQCQAIRLRLQLLSAADLLCQQSIERSVEEVVVRVLVPAGLGDYDQALCKVATVKIGSGIGLACAGVPWSHRCSRCYESTMPPPRQRRGGRRAPSSTSLLPNKCGPRGRNVGAVLGPGAIPDPRSQRVRLSRGTALCRKNLAYQIYFG